MSRRWVWNLERLETEGFIWIRPTQVAGFITEKLRFANGSRPRPGSWTAPSMRKGVVVVPGAPGTLKMPDSRRFGASHASIRLRTWASRKRFVKSGCEPDGTNRWNSVRRLAMLPANSVAAFFTLTSDAMDGLKHGIVFWRA